MTPIPNDKDRLTFKPFSGIITGEIIFSHLDQLFNTIAIEIAKELNYFEFYNDVSKIWSPSRKIKIINEKQERKKNKKTVYTIVPRGNGKTAKLQQMAEIEYGIFLNRNASKEDRNKYLRYKWFCQVLDDWDLFDYKYQLLEYSQKIPPLNRKCWISTRKD